MKLSTMFPARYVTGKVLTKPILAEIAGVEKARLRPAPDKPESDAFVMWVRSIDPSGVDVPIQGVEFVRGRGYRAVLRGTLAEKIAQIVGSDETDEWPGKRVVLFGEPTTVAGRDLIALRARAPKTQAAQVAQSAQIGTPSEPISPISVNGEARMKQAEAIGGAK